MMVSIRCFDIRGSEAGMLGQKLVIESVQLDKSDCDSPQHHNFCCGVLS